MVVEESSMQAFDGWVKAFIAHVEAKAWFRE
jgi:hypothetical protein